MGSVGEIIRLRRGVVVSTVSSLVFQSIKDAFEDDGKDEDEDIEEKEEDFEKDIRSRNRIVKASYPNCCKNVGRT